MLSYNDIWYAIAYGIVIVVLCIWGAMVLSLSMEVPRRVLRSLARLQDEWKTNRERRSWVRAADLPEHGSKEQG